MNSGLRGRCVRGSETGGRGRDISGNTSALQMRGFATHKDGFSHTRHPAPRAGTATQSGPEHAGPARAPWAQWGGGGAAYAAASILASSLTSAGVTSAFRASSRTPSMTVVPALGVLLLLLGADLVDEGRLVAHRELLREDAHHLFDGVLDLLTLRVVERVRDDASHSFASSAACGSVRKILRAIT